MFSFASVQCPQLLVSKDLENCPSVGLCRPLDLKIFSLLPLTSSHELKNSLRFFFRGNWYLKGLCALLYKILPSNFALAILNPFWCCWRALMQYSFFTPSTPVVSDDRLQPNLEALMYSENRMPMQKGTLWVFPSTCQKKNFLVITYLPCDYEMLGQNCSRHLNRSCGWHHKSKTE